MQPAARVGDGTAHGVPLTGSGSPNVLVGGRPAWRALADFSSCPLTTGTTPHVGGVVQDGSATVLVNSLPAARAGDAVVEAGPSNSIVQGCQSVLIG